MLFGKLTGGEKGSSVLKENVSDKWIGSVSNGTGKLVYGSTNVALAKHLHQIITVNTLHPCLPCEFKIITIIIALAALEIIHLSGQNKHRKAWRLWLSQGPEDKKT